MTESCLISTHWCQVSKDCLHFVLVNYSSGLEHSCLFHFWPEALLHKAVDHHWTIGIVSQNCNWGMRGAVSTWPWNNFCGCCFFVFEFVIVGGDFLLMCSLFPLNFNDSQLPVFHHRLAALFCKCTTRGRRRGTVSTSTWPNYVWSIEPLLLSLSWGRKDISWDWLPEYTALICFILLKSWEFLCQFYKWIENFVNLSLSDV